MICPECGTDNPEGSAFCMSCSASLGGGGGFKLAGSGSSQGFTTTPESSNNSVNDALFGGISPSYDPGFGPGSSSFPTAAKKSSPVPLIIALVAVVLIVVGVGFSILGWQYNGTYALDRIEMKYGDQELSYTKDQLEALAGTSMDVTLKVSFGRVTIKASSDYQGFGVRSGSGKIKFSGSKVTYTSGSDKMSGSYDKASKTLSIGFADSGLDMQMYFKKK